MEYNVIIECEKRSHFLFGKYKNRSTKGIISDDRHDNTHLSSSSNEITITKNTLTH